MIERLIILADDLTGAADCAGAFANDWSTVVAVEPESYYPTSVLSLNSESRASSTSQATARVLACANRLLREELPGKHVFFYKKIDSLLRGHPAIELTAMMDALGLERALVCPAFPAQNRLTRQGRQWAGVGLEWQEIDLHPLFTAEICRRPVHWCELEQVRQGSKTLVQAWESTHRGVILADAETEEDLDILVQAALRSSLRLACGSAGLARSLRRHLPLKKNHPNQFSSDHSLNGPVLIVAGSRSAVTLQQVQYANQQGIPLIQPDEAFLYQSQPNLERWTSVLVAHLKAGRDILFSTTSLADSPLGEKEIARRIAAVVSAALDAAPVSGLVLTGGDIALAVCRDLAAQFISLRGELQPGVPIGHLLNGRKPGLKIITKAGAFGGEDTLLKGIQRLKSR